MNHFDQRWQELASRARDASTISERAVADAAPFGFATRVLATAAAASGSATEELWLRWARCSVAVMAAAGLVLGAVEASAGRPHSLPNPGVENTVAQVLWTL